MSQLKGRSLSLTFILFFLFSTLFVHYYKIQVIEHEKWVKIGEQQHHFVVKEPFHRGKIYCRSENSPKGRCVVMDVLTHHLYIDPMGIKGENKEEMIATLEALIGQRGFSPSFYKPSRFRKIAEYLSLEKKEKVESWWKNFSKKYALPFNALTFVKDYKRSYPFDHLLGQVLSTVYKQRDEKSGKALPISGIEKVFDKDLQGEVGKRYLMRSPKYSIDDAKRYVEAKDGSDIYLTIHHEIQAICEEELQKGVEKVHGKGGLAVMMDPLSGEIIALAQYPFFSPENYPEYFIDKESEEKTKPKALTDVFEPGSLMKVLTMAIGLKANEERMLEGKAPLFDPLKMVPTKDPFFKGRNKPLKDVSLHSHLNMFLAIQKSSNIYPARVIEKVIDALGPQWYSDQLEQIFGLGVKSGIELPYESSGMIPIYGKKYLNGKDQWSQPTPYSLAIGYNVLVNAMQMVKAYAVFANGGYLVEPTLIDKIVSADGKHTVIKKEKKKVLSQSIAQIIMHSLKYSTKLGGTAGLADIPGYSEGGKSSTAEKIIDGKYSKNTHCSSFLGIAPIKNPKFVLIVVVDEPEKKYLTGFGSTHFGGKCAAPIFREIGKRALEMMKVPYDDPYGFSPDDPRTDKEKADWFKESYELKALYEQWNR
jgi:cell division protein FtsI (penicillin-binding protein 3)